MKKLNLSKEESLTILELGGTASELLTNETLMSEGQVIRSSTNQVQIHYKSLKQANHGVFSFHYQGILLVTMIETTVQNIWGCSIFFSYAHQMDVYIKAVML